MPTAVDRTTTDKINHKLLYHIVKIYISTNILLARGIHVWKKESLMTIDISSNTLLFSEFFKVPLKGKCRRGITSAAFTL